MGLMDPQESADFSPHGDGETFKELLENHHLKHKGSSFRDLPKPSGKSKNISISIQVTKDTKEQYSQTKSSFLKSAVQKCNWPVCF